MDRRTFLSVTGAALAAGGLRPPGRAADRLQRIGIQLYTLRHEMVKDVEGTLRAVADIGYREVEFAGYFDRPPAQLREILDRLRLTAPAAHVALGDTDDAWKRTLDAASVLGHRFVVVPGIPEAARTLDGYRRTADTFNHAAELARAAGLGFAYHNHDFEFTPIGERVPFDVLLEACDPRFVMFEMDLFWIIKGGGDPAAYFERYPGRFPMVHVKDMDEDGAMVDVGRGRIEFGRIFAMRRRAGIEHFFVEHDEPADPLASARASYRYLRSLEF